MQKLQKMNYHNVVLSPGVCQKQLQEVVAYLLALDEDRLLCQFRQGAGLPAPGTTYFGWYGQGATTFGQWIGAMAKLFRAMGDIRLREKMCRLLDAWKKCITPDGYVNFSPENKSTYGFEKMVGGLVDAYEYGQYEPGMDLLETITHWAEKHFDKGITRDYATYAHLASRAMHEWYTLGENYYRAYALSGREIFLHFAETWDYRRFWTDMARRNDQLPPLHAYSHVNSLCGAAMRYQLKGEAADLAAIQNAYELLTERHLFATGGYGPSEALFGKPGYLGASLLHQRERDMAGDHAFTDLEGFGTCDDVWGSCEVSCCAWAVFKLTNYLLQLTGDARYAQWAEQMIINGTLAQLPLEENGRVEYYANYFRHGARKELEDRRIGPEGNANFWQCCTGTFPQDVAAYHDLIYYQAADGVCIAQYIPSSAVLQVEEKTLRLQISGDYPLDEQYTIRVEPEEKTEFCLRLRIPSWAKDAAVQVNGEAWNTTAVPGQWLSICRQWQAGDRVLLLLPYRLRWQAVDAQHPQLMALSWGPVVLATEEIANLKGDPQQPEAWILPVPGEKGVFETLPGHDQAFAARTHRFRPFFSLDEKPWYYMYLNVSP